MKALLTKTYAGLVPSEPKSKDWYDKLKPGEVVSAEVKKVRNLAFHKKYFALMNIAFDNWTPGEINSKYGTPEKNFDRFRADCTILAGFYETVIRLDGSVRVEPKSISFSNMEEDVFNDLYQRTIDVLIKHVYNSKVSQEEIEKTVQLYLDFT